MSHVVVVGGGIAGLAAAYELRGGVAGPTAATPDVTVLEAATVGGKLQTASFAGRVVDVGPDGYLARRPEATALVHELGEEASLEPVGASGAWVYARGRLRRLPPGLALGVPTRLRDLGGAGTVGILGLTGALRAAVDFVAPRPASRSALPDRAIGPLVADKLGRRVVDVLVDPLLGGIHAGRVRDLSAAAVYPPVLAAGQGRGSMMRALQSPGAAPSDGPAFFSLTHGLGSLVGVLTSRLRALGVQVRDHDAVSSLARGAPGAPRWALETGEGRLAADAVVLACPPRSTAELLTGLDAHAATLVAGIDAASVVVVTLEFGPTEVPVPDTGTGVLVPAQTPHGGDAFLTSAVTFLDRKWPHLARESSMLLRVSAGKVDDRRALELDDGDLVARVCDELGGLFGSCGQPTASLVTRWPDSFPQYRVNHLARVDGIEAAAARLGGVAVAGAAYRGVGVPACVASGRGAARGVRAWLATQS
ncbi:MAG TPA: protoporphyrinogen oxidase [Acidimicrobiales bacterium]|nr:protoporphyrinogen oxidase [Acidimicrobiales bacterium]